MTHLTRKKQSGNVLLYILMAIALLAALNFALTRQQDSDGITGTLSADQARLKAQEVINYANAAKSTLEQMRMVNVDVASLSFIKPGEAGYDTGPHTGKIYHPVGGGLQVFAARGGLFADGSAQRGWVGQNALNVSWSATSAPDVVFAFVDLNPQICTSINDILYKSTTVPAATATASELFVPGGGDDVAITATNCPGCAGKMAQCITDSAGVSVYYSVLLSR